MMLNYSKSTGIVAIAATLVSGLAAPSAHAGEVLDKIKDRARVTVCTNVNNPPNVFLDSSGTAKGMQVDLMEDMKGQLGKVVGKDLAIELVPTLPANRVEFLDRGKCDMIFTSLTVTPERQKLIQFVEPYYYAAGPGLQTKKGVELKSWDDVRGKPICSNQGSSWNVPLERDYGVTIVAFQTQQEVDQSLRDGRCIALVSDDSYLQARFLTDKDGVWKDFEIQKLPAFSEGPWGLAVKFGDADLQKALSDITTEWHASGKVIDTAKKWGFTPPKFSYDMQDKYKKQ
ncbi:transporter substrate-binding domain-containing protein [Mesorhizobium zhangyense]|nr:transporter substrate-binding domain-containing protein [Mesorhizobium zhangyense]